MEDQILIENQAKPDSTKTSAGGRVVTLAVLLSLVAGGFGGFFGAQLQNRQAEMSVQSGSNPTTKQVVLKEESSVVDVVKKASPAVVSIVGSKTVGGWGSFGTELDPFYQFFGIRRPQPQRPTEPVTRQVSAGSGFFVTSDGLLFTNKHVVSDDSVDYSVVTNDQNTYKARIVAKDPVNDLAIMKVDIANAPTLSLADSNGIEIGQRVIAIGYSLGQYQNTVTTGVVSGIGRSITAGSLGGESEQLEGVIQTDAAINPGNSGGPLLNSLGQVIGINTAMDMEGQLIGFAIPSKDAQMALESYKKFGSIKRSYLGVRYVLIDEQTAKEQKLPKDYGALIVRGESINDFSVQPGSPADKAGLSENDIILSVNGQQIKQDISLARVLRDIPPGSEVVMRVYQNGQEKDIKVTLGER